MSRERGFSLVEVAIVVLIIGLLLGGIAVPLSAQLENRRLREASELLADIDAAIQGFAMVNGHLPCPATPASGGLAATAALACTTQHGFVPASTLGLRGLRNADNLLLDPWASPVRYSISNTDVDGDGAWDFAAPGELADVTMQNLTPDLLVCSTAAGSTASACADAASTLSDTAPLVIYSLGKDWASFSSADQLENAGATLGGGPSGATYAVAGDRVFVFRPVSSQAGNEYDDVIVWAAPAALYHALVDAGRLP